MNNQKFSIIPTLIENEKIIDDPKLKSNILNTHFADKSSVNSPSDEVPFLDSLPGIGQCNTLNTSPLETARIIRLTKKSHFSHCGISGKFLDMISTPISFSLSRLLNNHFEEGMFPSIWKLSHITPILKKAGLKSDKINYRPISLLPTLSKICESIIHQRLLSHCEEFSYLKGDSTINQLLTLIHKIRKSWSCKYVTCTVFLDIQGAFDKVWHAGLQAKLKQIGVEGKFLDLLKSYLLNRQQIVVIDGLKSDIKEIKAGVPQGSRLGPLLFIIYINDIVNELESDIFIFADDTTISCSGKDSEKTSEILNRDLDKILQWSKKWKVTFQPSKTKFILFSQTKIDYVPTLNFDKKEIKRVDTHKHLGFYLSFDLTWAKQMKYVCLKANQRLGVLRHIRFLN